MDYGKFKYESAMKAREARKNQVNTVIKEMKLRPKIDPHDYETKKGHVVRFLKQGDKVKITIMFRGREQSRPELGFRLLQRLAEDVAGARLRRVRAEAGRPQHDHGAGSAPRRRPSRAEAPPSASARRAERDRARRARRDAPTETPEPEPAPSPTERRRGLPEHRRRRTTSPSTEQHAPRAHAPTRRTTPCRR